MASPREAGGVSDDEVLRKAEGIRRKRSRQRLEEVAARTWKRFEAGLYANLWDAAYETGVHFGLGGTGDYGEIRQLVDLLEEQGAKEYGQDPIVCWKPKQRAKVSLPEALATCGFGERARHAFSRGWLRQATGETVRCAGCNMGFKGDRHADPSVLLMDGSAMHVDWTCINLRYGVNHETVLRIEAALSGPKPPPPPGQTEPTTLDAWPAPAPHKKPPP